MKARSTICRVLGALGLCLLPAGVLADDNFGSTGGRPLCKATSPERPYVCDVGAAQPISLRNFRALAARDGAVRSVVARTGYPDWAEKQRVDVESPWASYEIRIYYRAFNRMYAFGRAFLLDYPQVALVRYLGPIPPDKLAVITRVTQVSTATDDQVLRAERAADEAEALARRAEADASRAEGIANAEATEFKQSLMKH